MKPTKSESRLRCLERQVEELKAEVCRLEVLLRERELAEESEFKEFLDEMMHCPHHEVSIRNH